MLTAAGIASTNVVQPAGSFPWPDDYDAVIVAASVHGGKFQRNVCRWVQAYADHLNAKPSAFVPVCLGILQRDQAVQHQVRRIVDQFSSRKRLATVRDAHGCWRASLYSLQLAEALDDAAHRRQGGRRYRHQP
jgi:menaquinone-dependent protoporphyrinogen IX oxidase